MTDDSNARLCTHGGSRSLQKHLALAAVAGQARGSLELHPRFRPSSQLREQISAHRVQQVIALELS
jgi:hypothetical protein